MTAISAMILAIVPGGPSMAVPGPFWLFTVLHWLIFTLHLLSMNTLFGGVIVLLFYGNSPVRKLLFDEYLKMLPVVMAATITLGVAPLLFLQVIYGKFFYTATIISGWNLFLVVPVAIAVYYLLYLNAMKKNLSRTTRIKILAAVLIGFIYISYTFTMISDLAIKPHLWQKLYQASPEGMSLNPSHWQTIFRWGHIIAGAMAVAGIVVQLFAVFHNKVQGNRELLKFGRRVFLIGVIKSSLLGIIYLFTLENAILDGLLRSPGIHAIALGIVLNIIVVFLVQRTKTSTAPKRLVVSSSILVVIAVFCMVIGRHFLRLVYLEGFFDPAKLEIAPQWSVFAIFFVTFLAGLVTLFWMLRKYFTAPAKS